MFGKLMHSNWRLALALALTVGLAVGVMAISGSGLAKAQVVVPQLELDFATINWDQASSGATKVIAGDLIFESGGGSQSPTIKNNSDFGIRIAVVFSPLLLDSPDNPKTIDQFGACFGKHPSTIQCIDPVSASVSVQFDSDLARVLCPGEIGKLDVYVHPKPFQDLGQYSGNFEITASPALGVCAGDLGPAEGEDVLSIPAVVSIVLAGAAPVIKCAWQTPDMQPGATDATTPDPTIQYSAAGFNHLHDDDVAVAPSVTPACFGPPGSLPGQPNNIQNMIQITANINDLPEERRVQLLLAVDHPHGIQSIGIVFWSIFDPAGTQLFQVHGTKIGDSDAEKPSPSGGEFLPGFDQDNDVVFGTVGLSAAARRISECGQLGQSNVVGSMFEAAAHLGELSGAAVDDINVGIVARCMENVTAIYYARFSISSTQPCGEYRIEAHAVSLVGEAPVLTNFIDVVCGPNTPAGTDVIAEPVDEGSGDSPVTLTFSQVDDTGETSLQISGVGPPLPSGFSLGNPATYYELTTTATFSGSIEVCIDYTGVSFIGPEENLKLFHENTGLVDVTTSLDTINKIICGVVTSLSPFAIFLAPATEKIAFTTRRDGNDEIYVMNVDGSGQVNRTNDTGEDSFAAWSRDGKRIAFTSQRDGGNEEIYVMNADGSNQVNLTNDAANDNQPSWSPDGSEIAFASNRSGNFDIYVLNVADPSIPWRRLTTDPGPDIGPDWSPDGSKIAFYSERGLKAKNQDIYVMNSTDGSNETRLTTDPAGEEFPTWSPDSLRIAFNSYRNGEPDIYTMLGVDTDNNGTGDDLRRLTVNNVFDQHPTWSPDGTEIAFTTIRNGIDRDIYIMNAADGTNQTPLTDDPADDLAPHWGAPFDTPPPVITISSPAPFAVEAVGIAVIFSATDSASGLAPGSPRATIDDGTGPVSIISGSSVVLPGIYTLTVDAADNAGNLASESLMFVVYDPSAGFATGGGWIVPGNPGDSDPGDMLPGLDGTSKATFGFVVKYKKGVTTTPTGQLEFQYHVGSFNLHSLGHEWLVVTNSNWAKFQGTATITGMPGEFPFLVDARDGISQSDRFIIKIWAPGTDPDVDELIYKASGDLGGGQIKIHAK